MKKSLSIHSRSGSSLKKPKRTVLKSEESSYLCQYPGNTDKYLPSPISVQFNFRRREKRVDDSSYMTVTGLVEEKESDSVAILVFRVVVWT